MSAAPNPVRLQLLIRKEWQNELGIETLRTALAALGIEVTGVGRASLSGRVTPGVLETVFGATDRDTSAAPPYPDATLRVPSSLTTYVESITLAPRHEIISHQKGRDDK